MQEIPIISLKNASPGFYRFLWLIALQILAPVGITYANVSVDLLTVNKQNSFETLRTYTGRSLAGRASVLGFKTGGTVHEIFVDVGDLVKKGDPIARLDTRGAEAVLAQRRANVTLSRANLRVWRAEVQLARQTEQRFRTLRESGHASAQQYDEQKLNLDAKSARRDVARAEVESSEAALLAADITLQEALVSAPYAGVIQTRYMDEGTQAAPGISVVRIVDTKNVEARIGLPQHVAMSLARDSILTVNWGARSCKAQLVAVLPEVDAASRTQTAVLRMEDCELPLGSVVELKLKQQISTPGFWVPITALTESERGLWGVYALKESVVERRIVEIIHSEADRVFVRGTLENGDKIVRTGVQRLVPGQLVSQFQSN